MKQLREKIWSDTRIAYKIINSNNKIMCPILYEIKDNHFINNPIKNQIRYSIWEIMKYRGQNKNLID